MFFYRLVCAILRPLLFVLFRPSIEGEENVPPRGGCLLVANHRSFFDSFFQALAISRRMHWMAKAELFENPVAAFLLVRLGGFPVRRGQSDEDALETTRQLLRAGELVGIFPEGTRVREGLGEPKGGAARMAVECGVPIVPMGLVGTERGRLRRAMWHPAERVRMQFGLPVYPTAGPQENARDAARDLTDRRVWPQVKSAVNQLEAHRNAAVAAGLISLAAGAVIHRRRRR
jgi:1-acyl-sn-glycerol-3-phosphate acyltransferase